MKPTIKSKMSDELRKEAEELMQEIVLNKKYPVDQIFAVYNKIFETDEKPKKCSTCIERKVRKIKYWLKTDEGTVTDEKENLKNELLNNLLKTTDNLPIGLYEGKVGLCLYLFEKSRITGDEELEGKAFDLLRNAIVEMKKKATVDFEHGMTGIGVALDYLIRNKYIANDLNTMLKDIDNWIIARINGKKFRTDSATLLSLAYYFTMRLKEQPEGSDEEYIFRETIIQLINELHTGSYDKLFEEPFSFSLTYQLPLYIYVLGKIYEQGFYNYRIIKILEEISTRIVTYIPLSHSHRLSLVCAMKSVTNQVDPGGWENHIRILKREINMQHILQKELLNCHVGILDGVGGIYFLLKYHNSIFPDAERIDFAPEIFAERINSSEIWKYLVDDTAFFYQNRGLAFGLPGIFLTLDSIAESQ